MKDGSMSRLTMPAEKSRFEGPTPQRLIHSDGYVAIGDDQQGKRVYHMLDTVLDRTYSRLMQAAGQYDEKFLAVEYAALKRLLREYEEGGLMGSVGATDFNGSAGGDGRSFLAKNERQLHARDEIYRAKNQLSHWQWLVVRYVVLTDHSLEVAGYAMGHRSRRRGAEKARLILRSSGEHLARMWNMT